MAKKKRKKDKINDKKLIKYIKKESDFKKLNWKVFVICLIFVIAVAFAGSFSTNTGKWYEDIKPGIALPSWAFSIIWAIIYYMIAISMYYAWLSADNSEKRKKVIILFTNNFILNIAWSFIFFVLKDPGFALIDVIILFLSTATMVYINWKTCRRASYLLIPYLIWLIYAVILTYLAYI